MKKIRFIQIVCLLVGITFMILAIIIDRDDTLFLSIALGFTLVANLIGIIINKKSKSLN